jgi:hypothetical protein
MSRRFLTGYFGRSATHRFLGNATDGVTEQDRTEPACAPVGTEGDTAKQTVRTRNERVRQNSHLKKLDNELPVERHPYGQVQSQFSLSREANVCERRFGAR